MKMEDREAQRNNNNNAAADSDTGQQQRPTSVATDEGDTLRAGQQSDDNSSAGHNQNQNRPKRNPFCSRCRNHGICAQVKGHKRHCGYRYCQCEGCKLVEWRQVVSAAQIKRRRYQKQDEEYGRKIEISPPVLAKDIRHDPAALIARALTGSTQTPLTNPAAAILNSPPSSSSTSSIQLMNGPPTQASHLAQHQAGSGPGAANAAAPPTRHSDAGSSPGVSSAAASLAASAAHGNTLHLFHFPESVLTAAAAAMSNAAAHPTSLGAATQAALDNVNAVVARAAVTSNGRRQTGAHLSPMSPGSPPPNEREQISLIEDIQMNFGPLAIYAWLRAEHFDVQKIRDIIELSRIPFEELLQITGHSPLDLTSPIVD